MHTISNYLKKTTYVLLISSLWACKGGGDIVKPAESANTNLGTRTNVPRTILTPDTKHAIEQYASWKADFVTSEGCPKGKRVMFDNPSFTVSEGMGYGMLAAAYMNDQALFDDLFLYYNSFLDSKGLMHWKIANDASISGGNAATDADEDVALALIMANKRWGNNGRVAYLDSAKKVINRLMLHTVEAGTYVIKAGDMWGGSQTTNPSYYAPGYYKVFYEVTKDSSWLKVSDKCYEIISLAMNKNTGLVPDWCKATGEIPAANVSGMNLKGMAYYYDACRTPWRIATDYKWYQDPRALSL